MHLFVLLIGCTVAYNPNTKLVHITHKASEDGVVEFIDISNKLSNYIEYEMEVLLTGLQFVEGPKWIDISINDKDNNEITNGYLLFTEIKSNKIYKYYEDSSNKQYLQVMAEYDNCGPAGIAWSKNFKHEIWIACLRGAKVLKVDLNTFEIIKTFDKRDSSDNKNNDTSSSNYPIFADDIEMDSNGNVYITDYPPTYVSGISDENHSGGLYVILRDSDTIQLVEYINYGLNGIAINYDKSLMVVSNTIDLPLQIWDFNIFENHNNSNIYFKGYNMYSDKLIDAVNHGFMYLNTSEFDEHFSYNGKYHYFLDSSGFDKYDNFWQCVYLNDENGIVYGQISIVNYDNNNNNVNYIGTISIKDEDLAVNNIEPTADYKYMYATGGNWVSKNTGSLSRFKLIHDANDKSKKEL